MTPQLFIVRVWNNEDTLVLSRFLCLACARASARARQACW